MKRLGSVLMVLGVLLGTAVGLVVLFGVDIPGASWWMEVGLAKLALAGAAGLIAAGAVARRLARKAEERRVTSTALK